MVRKTLLVLAVLICWAGLLGLAGCGGAEKPYDADTEPGSLQTIVESKDAVAIQNAIDRVMEKSRNRTALNVMKDRLAKETDPTIKAALQKAVDELEPEVQKKWEEFQKGVGGVGGGGGG